MTRAEQKEKKSRKLKTSKILYTEEDHKQHLNECFDTTSEAFSKMMSIISLSQPDEDVFVHVHHIVPRSFFTKKKIPIDNSQWNLVRLTPYEHCLVHYYAWKAASSLMKRSMASAWHWMVNASEKGLRSIETVAAEYNRATLDIRNKPADVNKRLKKLGSTFICTKVDDKVHFKCSKCGLEKTVSRNWHSSEAVCKACHYTEKYSLVGKNVLVFCISAFDNHAHKFTVKFNNDTYDNRHTFESANFAVKRLLSSIESLKLKKWTVVGATDDEISYQSLLESAFIRQNQQKDIDNYAYFYHIDPAIANWLLRHNAFPTLPDSNPTRFIQERRKPEPHLYMCEELDIGAHTMDEWSELFGESCYKMNQHLHFKVLNTAANLQFLFDEYRKDPAILDRLKTLLDEMCRLNNNKDIRDYK